ncbi:GtrA family protein [Clostridium ljungdahlii]|uniref:GtrA-like protein n=1 Tax=Clostridium ljungdahlii TaxID=1538 RepID=A0A162KIU5_9CLOT|nr:GtrA family protein [Clostridium ljungdahlii]OAA83042.1 GtrA-like protein [Clostridium ljungdahlii]
MILNLLGRKKQFIKYAASGTLNTIITLVIYNLLIRVKVDYIISNTMAYIFGVANGFVLNKIWVFKADGRVSSLLTKFIIVNSISLIFSTAILFCLVNNLYLNEILAQMMATIITGIVNYILNKLWTFS